MTRPRGPRSRDEIIPLGAGHRVRVDPGALYGTIDDVRDATAERAFQAGHVVKVLRDHGWVVWTVPDMRRTTRGLFDVVAYHAKVPGLILLWELKSADGRVRPEQERAITHARTVPGVDARIVRPRDWPALRDCVLDTSSDVITALREIPDGL